MSEVFFNRRQQLVQQVPALFQRHIDAGSGLIHLYGKPLQPVVHQDEANDPDQDQTDPRRTQKKADIHVPFPRFVPDKILKKV